MAVTLTTSWQTVASYKHIFSGSSYGNNVTFYLEAKIGGTNATAGTASLYTRLRSAVSHTGWGGAGGAFKFTCDYAGEYTSNYEYMYGNKTILESSSPTSIAYNVDGTKTFKLNATVYDSSKQIGINPTVTISGDVTLPAITTYTLTVNGNLDGSINSNTNGYGTFTVSLNGGAHSSRVTSYSTKVIYGTTWAIGGPYPNTGKTYNGYSAGDKSGTVTGNTTVTIKFNSTKYTNTIGHYAAGFVNGEGNAGGRKQFIFLGDTSFTATYGSTITYDSSKFTTIPNGYTWSAMGSSSFNSSWIGYPLGQQFSQPASNTSMQFDYYPIPYTITYNLNGGTNNGANPTSYNVLYGVTFGNPTKKAYTFTGWTIDGVTVTGINPGATAQFADSTALYAGLKTRTTGNKTVVANWSPNQIVFNYYANNGDAEPFVTWTAKASGSYPDNHYNYSNGGYKQENPGYIATGYYGTTPDGGILVEEDEDFASYEALCNKYGIDINKQYNTVNLYAQWVPEETDVKIPVKVEGSWKTGVPYVKQSGEWKKGTKVYIKKEGVWVLSK